MKNIALSEDCKKLFDEALGKEINRIYEKELTEKQRREYIKHPAPLLTASKFVERLIKNFK